MRDFQTKYLESVPRDRQYMEEETVIEHGCGPGTLNTRYCLEPAGILRILEIVKKIWMQKLKSLADNSAYHCLSDHFRVWARPLQGHSFCPNLHHALRWDCHVPKLHLFACLLLQLASHASFFLAME